MGIRPGSFELISKRTCETPAGALARSIVTLITFTSPAWIVNGASGVQLIHGAGVCGLIDEIVKAPGPSLKIPNVVRGSPMARSRLIRGIAADSPPTRRSLTGVAVFCSLLRISLTLAPGSSCFSTAQAPATCGAAIEVPLKVAVPPPGTAEVMEDPAPAGGFVHRHWKPVPRRLDLLYRPR